jgi:hypothetical protein
MDLVNVVQTSHVRYNIHFPQCMVEHAVYGLGEHGIVEIGNPTDS